MGLDMYLERMPRYKECCANDVSAIEDFLSYNDYRKRPDSKKISFEQWCGREADSLPSNDAIEFYSGFYKVQEDHMFPHVSEEIGYWRKANAVHMCREYISHVVSDSADSTLGDGNPRGHNHLIIVMEELAELAQEISKVLRGKGRPTGVLEELADVQIGIYYVQEIMGISDEELAKAVAVKIKRLETVVYGHELEEIPFGGTSTSIGEDFMKG